MKTTIFKISLILFLFIANSFLFSQYKVIYEMKWKSHKKDSLYNKELCALTINRDKTSFFQSYSNFQRDSAVTKILKDYTSNGSKGQLRFPDSDENSKFRMLVIKKPQENKLNIEEVFYVKTFSVTYHCKMNWKITAETSMIFDYKCQKATCEFGGRKWIAWFSTAIPIFDGPYKFYGLPGLILKVEDEEKNYSYQAKAMVKEENDLSGRNFDSGKPVEVTPKQWNKFISEYKKQPSMILENLNTAQTTYVINGQDVSNKDVKDSYNKDEWKHLDYFANPIELVPSCN